MTPPLTDDELDERLRTAGALLDAATARRVADGAGRHPRRSEPRRALVLAAALLVVLAIGAAAVVALRGDDDAPTDEVHIATTVPPPTTGPADLGAALRALGLTGQIVSTETGLVDLATGEITPLVSPADILRNGWPVVVPDEDGGLYYLSLNPDVEQTQGEGPDVFGQSDLRHRTAAGADDVVQEGVYSFALRSDGALAMAIARDPVRTSVTVETNDVVVQDPDGTRTTWSPGPGGYQVSAWAGDRLLGQRHREDTEADDLVVFDAPGQVRDLAWWGGTGLIAPDGSWAMVYGEAPGSEWPGDSGPFAPPRILDLATGQEVGTIDPGYAQTAGALRWVGEDRAVGLSTAPSPSGPGSGPVGVVLELTVAEQAGSIRVVVTRRIVLDDRTHTPDEIDLAPDGTLLAPAPIVGPSPGSTGGAGLWACRPAATSCELLTLPFGELGDVGFVANPSRPLAAG